MQKFIKFLTISIFVSLNGPVSAQESAQTIFQIHEAELKKHFKEDAAEVAETLKVETVKLKEIYKIDQYEFWQQGEKESSVQKVEISVFEGQHKQTEKMVSFALLKKSAESKSEVVGFYAGKEGDPKTFQIYRFGSLILYYSSQALEKNISENRGKNWKDRSAKPSFAQLQDARQWLLKELSGVFEGPERKTLYYGYNRPSVTFSLFPNDDVYESQDMISFGRLEPFAEILIEEKFRSLNTEIIAQGRGTGFDRFSNVAAEANLEILKP